MELAADLRALRERAGVTLADLSNLSGLSAGTLSAAQSGMSVPTEKTLTAFVEACGERDASLWLARREAALRGARPAPSPSSRPAPHNDDGGMRLAWHSTWKRWDKSGILTPPSKASSPRSLSFWLSSLRAYRSVSFRSIARASGYSHTTLAAMAGGFQPVTVRGLMAFLDGCRVGTFAEKIEWLDLLERTSDSPRRRLDAARERARLTALSQGSEPSSPGSAPDGDSAAERSPVEWPEPARPAWPRQRAVHVDRHLLKTDLRALHRLYGPPFLPLLARHTGIASKVLQAYLRGEIDILTTNHTNRLAAAMVRMGTMPPPIERLPEALPPMADWPTSRTPMPRHAMATASGQQAR
ncbi:helix-turn-helix domain-containing protein [Streptomyces malaysiensis]|uniref:helix-turn-helix domain-containing protein n=1 Tax=Streptomyces malaysiensis TaxID=92644 RepID=UPI00369CB9BA